jgi:hypothetical protein
MADLTLARILIKITLGHAVALLVEALCYKLDVAGSTTNEVTGFSN